jgi:DNA polymerase-3 subunit alpha
MGIKVLGPDVNESIGDFSVNANGDIRFGMAAIKGVGGNVVEGIVTERGINGKFTGIFDLARRLDSKSINKKSLEALSLAGAFDSFEGITRSMFFALDKDGQTLTEKVIKYGNSFNSGSETNQASLFGEESDAQIMEPPLPKVDPWGQLEQLAREKEVVGFYISGHPLDEYKLEIQHLCRHTLADFADLKQQENKEIVVAGIITDVQHRTSKTGKPFGVFTLEDYTTSFEFILFGEDYIKFRNYLMTQFFLLVKGRVQSRFNQPGNLEFKILKIDLLSELKEKAVNSGDVSAEFIDRVESLISTYPGKCSFEIHVEDKNENMSVKMFSKTKKVGISNDLLLELNRLPGTECELK